MPDDLGHLDKVVMQRIKDHYRSCTSSSAYGYNQAEMTATFTQVRCSGCGAFLTNHIKCDYCAAPLVAKGRFEL